MSIEFIAEVSSNHNGSLNRCLKFVEKAKECECSGIKFQLFKIDELFSNEAQKFNPEIKKRRDWELSVKFLPEISEKCKELGIKFICTPFYLQAVDELEPFVDAYKIASYELLRHALFKKCAQTGKPVIISTGMATMDEVQKSVDVLADSGCRDITVLQCTSSYPAPVNQCNLSAIETMRKYLNAANIKLKFGLSDHSVNEAVILRAIYRWDAKMVEFHFDLDGRGAEFGGGHCWLPDKTSSLIKMVNDGFLADGDGKKEPQKIELDERNWRADPSDGLRPLKKIRGKPL